jgi:pimeloyl-ACP methyl ester carboxylesterase
MDKPTLILIPGWSSNEILWEHQTQSLADCVHPQVIVMNQEQNRDAMVKKVLSLAPERFLLAGQSMGGWVAQKVAATAPERVIKLFLVNTWSTPDPKFHALKQQVIQALQEGKLEEVIASHMHLILHPEKLKDPLIISKLHEEMVSLKIEVLCQQLQAMADDNDSLPLLPQIKAPTLVIAGRQDKLFALSEQQTIASGIQGAKLAIVEECGHVSPMEQPQAVTALMRLFIDN